MKVKAIVAAAIFAAATSAAMAAPGNIKGVNQNGFQEAVGTNPIYAIKHSGGVTSYRVIGNGNTVYTLSDANGSQYSKAVANMGSGNALAEAQFGWTYDLTKAKVTCQSSGSTSVIYVPGNTQAEFVSDNCAFANAAAN